MLIRSVATVTLVVGLLSAIPGGARGRPNPATRPTVRDIGWWRDRVAQINREARRKRPEVILVGDSIIYGWRFVGRPVWRRFFGRLPTANLGMDRDETGHLLWRLKHGNLSGLSPKVAVVLIGANNTAQRHQTPREIAAGVRAVVAEIRQRLPGSQVLLLGILPRGRPQSGVRGKIARTNALIAKLADRRVHYLDITSQLLDKRKRLSRQVSYDGLHLTARGYTLWATAMQQKLRKLLGGDHE